MKKRRDQRLRRQLDVREQFKEALSFIRESRVFTFLIIGVFFLSAVVGFVFASHLGILDQLLRDLIDQTEGLQFIPLLFFILQNNLMSALFALLLGAVTFGIFPIGGALLNGLVLGYVLEKVSAIAGPLVIWRLLPHGIFELPAVFLAMGFGMYLGLSVFARVSDRWVEFKRRFYRALNAFLMIVTPLLILAALIESALIVFFG